MTDAVAEARAFATRSPAAQFANYSEEVKEWFPGSDFIDRVVADLVNADGESLTLTENAAIIGRAFIMRRQCGHKAEADRVLALYESEVGN